MLSTMEKQLNESQRDALVTGYLNFVAPSLKGVNGNTVTVEDLYEYLLIDPEVGDEVETSRVAQAIASVQQYMTRLVNGSEPGRQAMEPSTANGWRDNDSQYAIWAAGAEVQDYAENYIAPTTRLEKSHYFKELETTLNQNQLDPDRVQDAALAYLNEFEAVSNLFMVNGYISPTTTDDEILSKACYYFIGRTTTKPYQYYWRQMDLSKNRADYQGNPVTPNCWSDWQPINLPLAGDTVLERTVRPVFYNNRLYIAWVERDPVAQNENSAPTNKHAYTLKFGYKRYDESWTAPNIAELVRKEDEGLSSPPTVSSYIIDESNDFGYVDSLIIEDRSLLPSDSNPNGRLMLSMLVVPQNGEKYENYAYLYCDSSFNRIPAPNLFDLYNKDDKGRLLQYPSLGTQLQLTDVVEGSSSDPTGSGLVNNLRSLAKGDTVNLTANNTTLSVESIIDADFKHSLFTFGENDQGKDSNCSLGFLGPDDCWTVTIRYDAKADAYYFKDTFLRSQFNAFGAFYTLEDGNYPVIINRQRAFPSKQGGIDVRDGSIDWHDNPQWGDNSIDLDGIEINRDSLTKAIGEGHFALWLDPVDQGYDYCASSISNIGKLTQINKYYQMI